MAHEPFLPFCGVAWGAPDYPWAGKLELYAGVARTEIEEDGTIRVRSSGMSFASVGVASTSQPGRCCYTHRSGKDAKWNQLNSILDDDIIARSLSATDGRATASRRSIERA